MAVSPNQFEFAYRPAEWQVNSTDGSIIRCIADVYVSGTLVATIEKSPNIGTINQFTFDLQGVLQDNLDSIVPNWSAGAQTLNAETSGGKQYTVRFFEVLDNGTTFDTSWAEDGAGTDFLNSTGTLNPAYTYNGTLLHEETHDLTAYQVGGTYGLLSKGYINSITYAGISTNKAKKVRRGDFIPYMGWINNNGTFFGKLFEYDANDTGIAGSPTTSAGITSATSKRFLHVIPTSILNSDTKKFIARITNSADANVVTDYIHYEVLEDCNDYVSFYFQNSVGGIDYYLFRNSKRKTYESDTQMYRQPLDISYNNYDFGKTVLHKKGMIGLQVVSDPSDSVEAEWLREIITHSTRAWILDGGNWIPVIVADGTMTSINADDSLYQLSCELIYSNDTIAQVS